MFGLLYRIQRYIDDSRGIIRADLFVSVGADSADGSKIGGCPIATFLSQHNLRKFSSPFDWLMNVNLGEVARLLQNNGDGFFTNIKEINKNSTSPMREIKDINTGMVAPHDFPRNENIDKHHCKFIEKHKRRFLRLLENIKNSRRVVFVSIRDIDIGEFKAFLKSMQKIHSAEYIFVNIRHNANLNTIIKRTIKVISGGGNLVIDYSFNNTHPQGDNDKLNPDVWLGNVEVWNKIMRKMKLPIKDSFANFWNIKWKKIKHSLQKRKRRILEV